MFTNDQIHQAKQVPITGYLKAKGIDPVRLEGHQYVYFSPFREERTPSFYVDPVKNVWNDFAEDCGDIIRLVIRLEGLNFVNATKKLHTLNLSNDQVQIVKNLPANPQKQHFIKRITPLKSKALVSYLEGRRINLKYAKRFVSEVHYGTGKGNFYGIGMQNVSGGWEIRNKNFKGSLGEKDLSYFPKNHKNITLCIFEGFIDFLSLLTLYGDSISDDYIVLNSTSLVGRVTQYSNKYKSIYTYFDNDITGNKVFEKLKKLLSESDVKIIDSSRVYDGYNDLNDYLISYQNVNKATTSRGSIGGKI